MLSSTELSSENTGKAWEPVRMKESRPVQPDTRAAWSRDVPPPAVFSRLRAATHLGTHHHRGREGDTRRGGPVLCMGSLGWADRTLTPFVTALRLCSLGFWL